MKIAWLCLYFLLICSANAETNADRIRQGVADLEKQWNNCYSLPSGPDFLNCLRAAALSSSGFYDKYVIYFRKILVARPDSDAVVRRFDKFQGNYLEYRNSQCRFESNMSASTEQKAYMQKARCHFRTVIDLLYKLDSYISQ
ncbi:MULTISPECIES: hypothetical protein [Methylobacterium]|uniref:Lysozyme inhibitor LprI N-terminal domain-containing protein n=2 Tax=Methylobacterium TaxID=407 RepID=A0A0C6FNN5_9HYPH|nr:hypothetical protein [Methylobacterium aquaticum]BAQ49963.1 hypothetical protein Maq22A_2p40890 [Methylobacterium aquaticum]